MMWLFSCYSTSHGWVNGQSSFRVALPCQLVPKYKPTQYTVTAVIFVRKKRKNFVPFRSKLTLGF